MLPDFSPDFFLRDHLKTRAKLGFSGDRLSVLR